MQHLQPRLAASGLLEGEAGRRGVAPQAEQDPVVSQCCAGSLAVAPDDEQWAFGVGGDPRPARAEQQSGEAAVAAGADDGEGGDPRCPT
ncbi:hypothetical protein GCM10010307_25730 [Streptomyces vastus]|uniref:Uncharacterized protein n=1 Tax=Streptomyces vastus TaxID=285451 RepID=A0ABN3QR36_9ACTN